MIMVAKQTNSLCSFRFAFLSSENEIIWMFSNSDGSHNPQRFHRKPGAGRPASLPLHHPPHPHRPGQQVLGPRPRHGKE